MTDAIHNYILPDKHHIARPEDYTGRTDLSAANAETKAIPGKTFL